MITKMNELNRELLLDELSNFEQKKSGEIPDILNKYLESIAQNGDTMFSWIKLQPLLRRKLELVMNEFNELCPTDHLIPLPNVRPFNFEELKQQILTAIDSFCSAPFTVQRICELITSPSKHYKRTDKFMRGIEKNILVVTTVEPKSADGSSTQYSTSSFKNLFSSLHSTSNSGSLSSPSTSLLVNGMADVICDQQMAIHCSNESDLHHMSSPVSPNSLPLSSHSSNSPPNPHLAPLQQLDSFTTVFASAPSTPLSVVSDLHTYDHSSSLSLMTSSTSGENLLTSSSENKITETYFETNPSPQTETIGFSNNTTDNKNDSSLQTTSSSDTVSETKLDVNQDVSESESNQTKQTESDQNSTQTEVVQQLSETTTKDTINDISVNEKTEEEKVVKQETALNETKTSVTLSESSVPTNDNKTENKETTKIENTPIETQSDIPLSSEVSKTRVEEPTNVSQNNQLTQNIDNNEMRITTDEEMCQPMDDFNGVNANNTDNNTDMADCSDKTPDLTRDVMDQTSSQSDLSEPMDED